MGKLDKIFTLADGIQQKFPTANFHFRHCNAKLFFTRPYYALTFPLHSPLLTLPYILYEYVR